MVKQHGFTLVELLVSITLMAVIGVAINTIFITTLKSANKADIMKEIKQNGEYASTVMEQMIRNAQTIQDVGGLGVCTSAGLSGSSIRILNSDDHTSTFQLSAGQISSTGGMLTNNLKTSATNLIFTCSKIGNAPPTVTFSFTISQLGTPAKAEEKATMNFRTTVSLRSYSN